MGLHLRHGQQAWGHGLGRSWRDLPPTISGGSRARTPTAMPVRSLTQSLLRWPEPKQILNQVRLWAAQVAAHHPGLEQVGLATALQRDSRWLCGGAARFGAFVAAGAD